MKIFDVSDTNASLLGHHFLEASAGTGKTFTIEHITKRLILECTFDLSEILIVTFTRAATRELKVRIQKTLKKAEPSPPIEKALSQIDQASIYTIHGFCHRMLSEYAFEAGLPPPTFCENATDYQESLKTHVIDFLRTGLNPSKYSAAQLAALPESQETWIRSLLALLEKEGKFPSYPSFEEAHKRYLAIRKTLPSLTFEHLSFRTIKDKTGALKEPFLTQFYLLQKESLSLEEFEILTAHPSLLEKLIPENLSKKGSFDLTPVFAFQSALLPILKPTSSPSCTLIRMAQEMRISARQCLEEKGLFSPNTLLKKMEECLTIPAFCSKVRSRYRAAIIDEFQDTDPLQWNIFKTLFIDLPIPALYLVGDPKQSIYSFRSADLHTYLKAQTFVPQKSYLNTNYRSDPSLIEALNDLFSQNQEFLSTADLPLPFYPVSCPDKESRIFPDQKKPIHYFVYKTEKTKEKGWPSPLIEEQVFFPFIASEILFLKEHGFAYSDFAILVKDRYQGDRLNHFLETQNIPTQFKRTKPLSESPSFFFLRALLESLINPNEMTIKHLLSFSHSHQELKENPSLITKSLAECLRSETLCQVLRTRSIPHEIESSNAFRFLLEKLLRHQNETRGTLSELLLFLLSQKDLSPPPLSDRNSVTLLTTHLSKGLEFNIVFPLGLINRYTGREPLIRYRDEWLSFDSNHPQYQAALKDQDSEKLRQLYVALTRAKERLYIPLLIDTSHSPIPIGQASPLELFNPTPTDATFLSPKTLPPPSPSPPNLSPPLSPKKPFSPCFIHSYSSLATIHLPTEPLAQTHSQLPAGAKTGRLFHLLLEKLARNPNQCIPSLLKEMLPPDFPYESALSLLHNAFHTPLSPHCFSLSEVQFLYPEVEFFYPDPPHFIKGYIDLIFLHDHQFFLLDWKTNDLPSYEPSFLQEVMKKQDYLLQSSLYQTALSRYLSQIQSNAPLAGTYYIFLRGLPSSGILYFPQ